MKKNTTTRSWLKVFSQSYNIITLDRQTLKEKFIFSFKGYQLFGILIYLLLLVSFLFFFLIAFGPLAKLLPETQFTQKKDLIELVVMVDSLEKSLVLKTNYINILRQSLHGNHPDSSHKFNSVVSTIKNISAKKSKEDSVLRQLVESEDFYNIPINTSVVLEDLVFFQPINGIVTTEFNLNEKHFGIDVVSVKDQSVKSCLDGIVLFSGWSTEYGHVIIIQHSDNIVSLYMHNSTVTKQSNESVLAGEVIGIVGNSGHLSSGPHLHFELWQNGNPINPLEYIDF